MARRKSTKKEATKKEAPQRKPPEAQHPPVETQEAEVAVADPPVEQQVPPVEAAEPAVEMPEGLPGRFWPEDEPMPEKWVKVRRQPPPCPHCRRVRLDNGGQAAVCCSSGNGVAFFRCRACGGRWQLPVREI